MRFGPAKTTRKYPHQQRMRPDGGGDGAPDKAKKLLERQFSERIWEQIMRDNGKLQVPGYKETVRRGAVIAVEPDHTLPSKTDIANSYKARNDS